MCGITGYYLSSEIEIDDPECSLIKALSRIGHRGPDDSDIWIADNKRIGLGHCLLAIMDSESGKQPFFNDDRSIVAVTNGEFYGYQKTKCDLRLKGYKFRTKSDSEILIPLYQEYGLGMFDKLQGEFSFIIYDKVKDLLIAARDRFGVKPLFYTNTGNNYYFGSEIKAILSFTNSMEWDFTTLIAGNFFVPNPEATYFKNIKAIKPGHYMTIQNGCAQQRTYWDLDYSHPEDFLTVEEACSELRNALQVSTQERLESEGKVGCYLSSGIDSTAILALASQSTSKRINTFSIGFGDTNFDESQGSRETAEYYNAVNHCIEVNEEDLADNYSDAIFHNESTVYNTQGVAKFLLSKAVKQSGIKTVLTGEGSDELFAGYPFFRQDGTVITSTLNNTSPIDAGVYLASQYFDDYLEKINSMIGFIPSMWHIGVSYGLEFENLYSADFLSYSKSLNPFVAVLNHLDTARIKTFDNLNKSLYIFSKTNLPRTMLSYLGDRMEMGHSVEGRLPFLDQRVVELCQRLPSSLKSHNLIDKYVLRESLKGLIPERVYYQPKKPFTAPPIIRQKSEKRSCLQSMLMDIVETNFHNHLPFYNAKKIQSFLLKLENESLEKRSSADPIVSQILSSYFLAQRFKL